MIKAVSLRSFALSKFSTTCASQNFSNSFFVLIFFIVVSVYSIGEKLRENSEKTRIFAKNNDYFAQNMRKIDEILAIGDGRQIYSLLTNRKRPFKVPFKVSEEQ